MTGHITEVKTNTKDKNRTALTEIPSLEKAASIPRNTHSAATKGVERRHLLLSTQTMSAGNLAGTARHVTWFMYTAKQDI